MAAASGWRQTPGTRAKDSDRTETCQTLDGALADGQLSMEDHQHRVDAAMRATTLGDLQALVADLQLGRPPQSSARPRRSRRNLMIFAVVGGLLVLGLLIAWATWRTTPSAPTATPSPSTEVPTTPEAAHSLTPTTSDVPAVVLARPGQLLTVEGMAGVFDAMRKRFGDTMGYELAITPDDAMLARPDPADDRSKLVYPYRGGWGDPSGRPKSDTDDLTDLGAFDVPAAVAALQAAPDTLKIAADDVADTVVDIDHIADPDGPGALELLVKVTTKSGADGFVYLDGAGNIKRVEGPS